MDKIKNTLICGLGAIGSIYADKISEFDNTNLKILVDETRIQKYKNNPIIYNNKPLNLNYILPNEKDFKADLIVISTKADGLMWACENIKNFVHEKTIILPLLNGIESEEILASKYGWERVLNAYVICHSSMRTGQHITHDGVNTIFFGTKSPQNNKIEILKQFFNNAKINYETPEDIIYSQWKKFALNACANPLTAIYGLTFGEALKNKDFMDEALHIIQEVVQIAKAEGINNTDNLVSEVIEVLKAMLPDGKTSMLQDIEANRKTEIDIFAGTIIKLGKKHNIPTPYNNKILIKINNLENK
ncbi:ketopantoate reductase family protein [bacterium]|nr:ketopantoate reductase family protein [bacterium]